MRSLNLPVALLVFLHFALLPVFSSDSPDFSIIRYTPELSSDNPTIKTGSSVLSATPDNPLPDLSISFISMSPIYERYRVIYKDISRFPLLVNPNAKYSPDVQEPVTFTAHISNQGFAPANNVLIRWAIDDSPVSNTSRASVNSCETFLSRLTIPWPKLPQNISLTVSCDDTEVSNDNNHLAQLTHALRIQFLVTHEFLETFNSNKNDLTNTYCFADWLQKHFEKFNSILANSIYSSAPNGALDRITLDRIKVLDIPYQEKFALTANIFDDVLGIRYYDGTWILGNPPSGFIPQDQDSIESPDMTTEQIICTAWADYYFQHFRAELDFGLLHELGHQIGLIDEGVIELPANNRTFPGVSFSFPGGMREYCPSLMHGQGDFLSEHSVLALNTNYLKRRGYYAEFLYDLPETIGIKLVDPIGNPVSAAELRFYQDKGSGGIFLRHIPELDGWTDTAGCYILPNRDVSGERVTATGHILRNNPFKYIELPGWNCYLVLEIRKYNQVHYETINVAELNLAYWKGYADSFQLTKTVPISNFPIDTANNIAHGKPISVSYCHPSFYFPGANDGEFSDPYSAWFPDGHIGEYLQIDLVHEYQIGLVVVYPNRTHPREMFNFLLYGSSTGEFLGEETLILDEHDWGSHFSTRYAYPMNNQISVRYVRMVCNEAGGFGTLQELEIFPIVDEDTIDASDYITPTPTATPIPNSLSSGTNLALLRPVRSSEYMIANATYAVDGYYRDEVITETYYNAWIPHPLFGCWMEVDLGNVFNLYEVDLYPCIKDLNNWFCSLLIFSSTTGEFCGEENLIADMKNYSLIPRDERFPIKYLFPPRPARYIRVVNNFNSTAVFSEIMAFATFDGADPTIIPSPTPSPTPIPIDHSGRITSNTNIALYKPTDTNRAASTTLSEYAVDGIFDIPHLHWAPITNEGAWFEVDLLQTFMIDRIVIYPYYNDRFSFFQSFEILGSETGEFIGEEYEIVSESDWRKAASAEIPVVYRIPGENKTQYVRIYNTSTGSTAILNEIEIYPRISEAISDWPVK